MKAAIIAILAVVIVGGGGYAVLHKNKKTDVNTQTTASTPAAETPQSSTAGQTDSTRAASTITYSNSGFSPATIAVKAGDTVAIKNTSSHELQMDSDPHPVHTDDPDLNVGTVAPGQTMTFTVTKTGNFGYHNHLNPSDTGKIVIQ